MPFRDQTAITLRQSTKDELARFKADSETWDDFLAWAADSALDGGDRQ